MTKSTLVGKWSAAVASAGLGLALTMSAHVQAAPTERAAPSTVVATANGKVRGTIDGRIRSFQGIPYATAPVGELRWKAPRPANSWSGIRPATTAGAPCAQPVGLPVGIPSEKEDCLYLNVTTSATKTTDQRPVLVWIHGGSLMYGSGDMYGPKSLAANGAVVVSMNYRLGILGHLSDPSQPGADGLSLQDQQAALRWVRANVTAFGGDPANVTIMGQSGGGYSVCGHLASPASAGLFQRAIIQSAPCTTDGSRSRADADADAKRVIAAVHCEQNTATCLRRTAVAKLLAAYGPLNEPRPVTGTTLMPLSSAEALRTGRFNRVPVLIGVNHDEERGMVLGQELAQGAPMKSADYEPAIRAQFGDNADAVLERYPLSSFPSAGEALAAAKTDALWSTPTLDTARLLSQWTPTKMYEFSERNTPWFNNYPEPSFQQRAGHMTELPYLFDDISLFEDIAAEQTRLRSRMLLTWTGFATSGETAWPAFDGQDGHVQTLASDGWTRADFTTDHHYDFWTSLS